MQQIQLPKQNRLGQPCCFKLPFVVVVGVGVVVVVVVVNFQPCFRIVCAFVALLVQINVYMMDKLGLLKVRMGYELHAEKVLARGEPWRPCLEKFCPQFNYLGPLI